MIERVDYDREGGVGSKVSPLDDVATKLSSGDKARDGRLVRQDCDLCHKEQE